MSQSDPRYTIKGASEAQQQAVDLLASQFLLTDERLGSITKEFRRRMEEGLASDGRVLKMIPSYITQRPTGTEMGSFIAVDLGGTNLRVLRVTLDGSGGVSTDPQRFVLTEDAKSRSLFDFMAQCVETFLDDRNIRPTGLQPPIHMGLTFSYPVQQTSLNSGTLVQWTKGLNVPGCVGRDVVRLLQDALLRLGLRVKVAALVNDTVGTLLSAAYSDPTAQMGVILGTGTNAAYYEDEANVAKWKGEGGEIVLNMEWGAFDSDDFSVLPFTQHDIKLDRKSINPRKQAYEKMISGMYLGEIARNVMLWLADQRLLLDGRSSEVLNAMWSIDTAYLSAATVDDSPDLEEIQQIIEKTLNVPQSTLVDRQIFKIISILVGERSARLSAVGIVATLTKRPELLNKPINVGIDGSMYEHYPEFERIMAETVSHFIPPEQFKNVKFSLAKDGSGVGAAIAAMLATKEL
ncbi:hypothetical protein LPJ77_003425 [Coemansia sp. RSA 2523]|nr:hypothetical protein LPJ58_000669 [Coemansia sp. RSA 1591]KAJ1776511.1 hypothetical protein LPJ54_003025 [Coemansia sp. RSA 1824]KAJ1787982.1 hypothetical protein LPJ62_003109 [Coemansia sp. RSA 2167]KAJ1794589.1 hypothetical protein LPJ67_000636 [Coemansia sp. RSA 1938]KAJ1806758.1 hypothetical protein LPJ77_003425 [Coemansia sp. RSA 2523]KAJ2132126.1 hypothetical protein GGF48_001139 [Coemansia sp. RSA 921]KAJ2138480.1 hypothetical protein GGH17_001097 [Coemansia sp. RSA 788]KAJ2145013.